MKINIREKHFNTGLALLTSIVNCILLTMYFLNYGEQSYGHDKYGVMCFGFLLVIPLQLGIITRYTSKKKLFKTLTIVTTVLILLFFMFLVYVSELAKVFQH